MEKNVPALRLVERDEAPESVGAKHAKLPGRRASRQRSAPGSVVLGGRRVRVERPRARTAEGEEVTLQTYDAVAGDDLLTTVVMERMLTGLATRRYRAANEPVGAELRHPPRRRRLAASPTPT